MCLPDYTPTAVNAEIKQAIDDFRGKAEDVTITQTGEGKQQAETGAFLATGTYVCTYAHTFYPGAPVQFNQ